MVDALRRKSANFSSPLVLLLFPPTCFSLSLSVVFWTDRAVNKKKRQNCRIYISRAELLHLRLFPLRERNYVFSPAVIAGPSRKITYDIDRDWSSVLANVRGGGVGGRLGTKGRHDWISPRWDNNELPIDSIIPLKFSNNGTDFLPPGEREKEGGGGGRRNIIRSKFFRHVNGN